MADASVIVVGGGASGLSAAAALKQRGIDALVLEQDPQVGGTWARRYDRLHLHTVRRFSGLAHYGIPRRYPKYLPRDQFVAYLREYAEHFRLNIVTGCEVTEIARDSAESRWKVATADGKTWKSDAIVVATGQYRAPIKPTWPGVDSYTGWLSHSVGYSNPKPYIGKRVLVVGAGNSGAEIATDIAENGAKFVALSIRTPPMIVPRDPFGMPVQRTGILLSFLPPALADRLGRLTARIVLGDLTQLKIPRPSWGPYSAKRIPLIDVGFVDAVRRGLVQVRPGVQRLSPTGAVYADGVEEPFDAIVAAIGFETGLASLIEGAGVLNEAAEPLAASGEETARPGLYFIGFVHSLRGHLFEANRASKRLARNVEKYLGTNTDSKANYLAGS
ncbi:MAG TPA: NAD(P)/FAD-dependent oxidoreductase [Gemmatimonadaceae bacterium]|nr:NAD(P)/FAD-dependent oxidoreductase [Gemmatimonadaceae bacterium]